MSEPFFFALFHLVLRQQRHPINVTSYQVIFLPISWGCCISRLNRSKQIVESRPKSKRTQSLRFYRRHCQGKLSVRWVFHQGQCMHRQACIDTLGTEKLVEPCCPIPKTLSKICDFPHPIYDLTKNLIPHLSPDP